MEQYICKAALVAEIKKIEKLSKDKAENAVDTYFKIHFDGWATACRSILSYLDTLEAKDANEALRTEYEKGRADVIAKTLEWINVFNDNNYIMQYSDSCEHPINEIIEGYKNYINRE